MVDELHVGRESLSSISAAEDLHDTSLGICGQCPLLVLYVLWVELDGPFSTRLCNYVTSVFIICVCLKA